jgi:hypothetical protein
MMELELQQPILFERAWALASKRTFTIEPIAKLIRKEMLPGRVVEPFPYQSREDVFDYLARIPDNSCSFGLVDPPYSKRQVSEHYKEIGVVVSGWHTSSGWTAKVKRETARKIKVGGKAITFGWNSAGLGKGNGFKITKILLVNHGGDHYDTICTVEQRVQSILDFNSSDSKSIKEQMI